MMPSRAFFITLWSTGGSADEARAVAIPVIIHLINRRALTRSSLGGDEVSPGCAKTDAQTHAASSRLLLLLCRMLILAAHPHRDGGRHVRWRRISTAWAWLGVWQGQRPQPRSAARTASITSSSSDASPQHESKADGEQPAFELLARQLGAQENPETTHAADGYSVLIPKDSPTWLVGEASQNARKVHRGD